MSTSDGDQAFLITDAGIPELSANYFSVAQIFLRANALQSRPLTKDDVKQRLLGHFGTWSVIISVLPVSHLEPNLSVRPSISPGLNLTYAHLLALISREEAKGNDLKSIYVTGAYQTRHFNPNWTPAYGLRPL